MLTFKPKITSDINSAITLTINDAANGIIIKSFIENGMEITIFNKYNYAIKHIIQNDNLVIESNDIVVLHIGHSMELDIKSKLRIQEYETTSHLIPIGVEQDENNNLFIVLHNVSDKPILLENEKYICTLELYHPISILNL